MALKTKFVDFDVLPENIGAIGVMGVEGDTKHVWDPDDPKEVEEARTLFNLLTEKKYRAFHLKKKEQGEQMTMFDPSAKRILFIPPFAGG